MSEQWERLTRALGNVFYPLLEKILPYINAILMVLTEIFNFIAKLLGFKMPDFDYSGLASVNELALDIEENINGAGSSADNLKKKLNSLRSFDKLNVISTQQNVSSGSGTGGIDQRILDAFKRASAEYYDMMDKVKMKANDIRDSIMQWLGFEKQFNEEGEESWVFKEITPGTIIGALAIGSPFVLGIATILDIFKKIGSTDFYKNLFKSKAVSILFTIAGVAFTFDATKKILDGDTTWGTIFEGLGGSAMLAYGTWNLTHSVTITLAVTAISLVPQSAGVLKTGWNKLLKEVDAFMNNDGKTTWREYMLAWADGERIFIDRYVKKFFSSLFDNIKNEIVTAIADLAEWLSGNGVVATMREKLGWDKTGKKGSSDITKSGGGINLSSISGDSVRDGISNGIDYFINNDAEDKGVEIGKALKKGIESQSPEVKISPKGDMNKFKQNIVSAFEKMNKVAGAILNALGIDAFAIKALTNLKLASGGMPPVGQLFIANEKGPELVGQIGGQSFVANQNQMMDLLDKKIGNAQKSTGTQVINLYLDADHKIGSYALDQLQNMAKTDGKPITIGG